ncbi:hypothetical protein Tco_1269091 [Tanacetum coccineum]
MVVKDTLSPPPPSTSTDKLISFSIANKVHIKLDLEKHNYNSWRSFCIIHLGSLGLKPHVEAETSSTNPEWCKLDDLIKMWILRSLCDSLQNQFVTTPGKMTINEYFTKIKSMVDRLKNLGCVVSEKNLVIYAVNRLDTRFATLVEIIRHHEPLPTFETVRNMLLLKEPSINDQSGASTTFESSSSSPTILMDRCKFIHDHRYRVGLSSTPRNEIHYVSSQTVSLGGLAVYQPREAKPQPTHMRLAHNQPTLNACVTH